MVTRSKNLRNRSMAEVSSGWRRLEQPTSAAAARWVWF
jgi:hypothetical protein